jgi:3-dehydroquinate synthase
MSIELDSLEIKSNLKNYRAYFSNENDFIAELKNIKNSVFIIDKNVFNLHQGGCLSTLNDIDKIILAIDEDRKNLDTVTELYDQIITRSPKKNLTIISIGGGILQDLTGFLASTLYRGVNWIFVPTTLLAQADSCIGAKTSLNYKNYKNLIGTFYPPSKIYLYPDFLRTLDQIDFFSGVGEIAKLHIMSGQEDCLDFKKSINGIINFDSAIILKLVRNSLLIKKHYIEEDEFDTGRRNMLNYGHCFGHAIESSTNFAIPHGQAVVLGMILANIVANKKNILSDENEKYLREKILLPILKIDLSKIPLNFDDILKAMSHDKKNIGLGLALIMVKNGYEMVRINDLSKEEAALALQKFSKLI